MSMERPYTSNLAFIQTRPKFEPSLYLKKSCADPRLLFEPWPIFEPGFFTDKYRIWRDMTLLMAAEFFPFVRCEYACCLSCLPEVCSWPVPQCQALECRLVGFTAQSNHKHACQPVNVVGLNKMYTECSVGTTRALKLSILFSCTILSFPYLPQCSVHPCCSSTHSSILS